MQHVVTVKALDHIVLRVPDPVASLHWWCATLGLTPVRVEEFQQGKVPFPSARLSASLLVDFFRAPQTNSAEPEAPQKPAPPTPPPGQQQPQALDHICFALEDGIDMHALSQQLTTAGVPPQQQFDGTVVRRFGARGTALSLYITSPEGITLELRSYPGAD